MIKELYAENRQDEGSGYDAEEESIYDKKTFME